MSKTMRLIGAAAAAALALPAMAGSWPPIAPRKAPDVGAKLVRVDTMPRTAIATTAASPVAGFEYAGGDSGWVLSQHKYVFAGGRFAMSDECDHAIRTAKAATPAEIETARKLSPGA